MSYDVELPNGDIIEVPDNISREEAKQKIYKAYPQFAPKPDESKSGFSLKSKTELTGPGTNAVSGIAQPSKPEANLPPPLVAATASSLLGIAITWAIVRYALPKRYAQSRRVDRSANVMYIAGWMLSIAIGVNIGNMANEIIFSSVMGHELNQNNIHKSLIGVVIWPLLIYAIGYVIAKTISALGKPSRAGVIRTAAAPDASAKGLAEQLTQLNELYKQGALSKEQFEAAKVKLLG